MPASYEEIWKMYESSERLVTAQVAEIERLRAALKEIADSDPWDTWQAVRAREALMSRI